MLRIDRIFALLCISLAACQGGEDITGGLGGLAVEATAAVLPPPAQNVRVTAKITNISTNTIQVNYGGCSVAPVFHTGSLTGPVVYDPRPTQECTLVATTKSLDPNQSIQITGGAVPNLPPGKYYIDAIIAVNGGEVAVGAGTVTF